MSIEPERLHVIRCYDRLPPMPGGMERHIAELTAAQRRQGVRVTEIYNSGAPSGESVRLLPALRTDKVRPNLLRWLLFYSAAALKQVDVADGRIPVVHIHGDWQAYLLGAALARRIGAELVAATLHDWARGSRKAYAFALRSFNPIFSTGLQEARLLSEITGKQVIYLPSAPAELFFLPPRSPGEPADVIVVGSLVPRKNMDAVIECAALRPHWTFAVYGEGPERERLERLRVGRGLNNVVFHGARKAEEVHSAMCAARLFLNTASAEGSPTAALEAMACGLPVALTPSNDYSRIIQQGLNGRVTRGFAAEELACAIDEFLEDPARLAKAATQSRRVAEAHRWDEKARIVTDAMIASLKGGR
jgi:glycosyltransferase involved in cell wall biosynthesis